MKLKGKQFDLKTIDEAVDRAKRILVDRAEGSSLFETDGSCCEDCRCSFHAEYPGDLYCQECFDVNIGVANQRGAAGVLISQKINEARQKILKVRRAKDARFPPGWPV